jgi:hypothetical protein
MPKSRPLRGATHFFSHRTRRVVLVLSIHLTTAKVGRRPKICHPDRSGAEGRDLQFAFMKKQNPDDSPTALSLSPKVKLQVPPLRSATVGMTNFRVAAHLGSGAGGRTESTNEANLAGLLLWVTIRLPRERVYGRRRLPSPPMLAEPHRSGPSPCGNCPFPG